jgi:5'-nucleotidase
MNGVLADADQAVMQRMAELHPDAKPAENRPNYFVARDYPPEVEAAAWAIIAEPGFFADLPVVEGALDGWQRIIDAGYRPQICSSRMGHAERSIDEKLEWIDRVMVPRFGRWVLNEAVIVRDKSTVAGIALIDERPEVPKAREASWQQLMFHRPTHTFNHHVEKAARLEGWSDPWLGALLAATKQQYRRRQLSA